MANNQLKSLILIFVQALRWTHRYRARRLPSTAATMVPPPETNPKAAAFGGPLRGFGP
jgi:hypothetical protein